MGVETENRQKKIWNWNWNWKWKVVFLSLCLILSVVFFIMFKGVILGSFSFVVGFWNSLWSSPLYIYMIINSMVLLIALLSKSHPQTLVSTTQNSPTSTLYQQCIDDADQVSSDKQLEHEGQKQQDQDQDQDQDDDDTMDATWKAISGNKLTKSETFTQTEAPASASASASALWKDLKKSETFNEAVSIRRIGGMMRRDPSVGIDEFNHKVEAFIKKFNDDIKLQRQQSDQRFIDMINRGL